MKISYNWLQSYFETPLPQPEKLAELFIAHVFEVEERTEHTGLVNGETITDTIFDVKVLPDRAHYLLSHVGIAREASLISEARLKPEFDQVSINAHGAQGHAKPFDLEKDIVGVPSITVTIEDGLLCRRYIAVEVENIAMGETPAWIKNRLETVGQKSINTIVDIANYVMLDTGQPLHAFDADKLEGNLVVRTATTDEKIIILNGDEKTLTTSDLVIADSTGPVAIAGIKGGKRAEVTADTKRIIIEAANFDPVAIRKTATRLNLRNDSSKRFENEITPQFAYTGMEEMVKMIKHVLIDSSVVGMSDVYTSPALEWEVMIKPDHISSLVGVEITAAEIEGVLIRMGCRLKQEGDQIAVMPPLARLDMMIPEDIADEVARIIGYEQLPAKLPPNIDNSMLPDKVFFYGEKTKNILVERGYSEGYLYSLVAKGVHEVVYPLASDKSALRDRLETKLSEALIFNGRNADLLSLDTIKICEIGKVFREDGEKTILALGVLQVKKKKGVTSDKILLEDLQALATGLGIAGATIVGADAGASNGVDIGILANVADIKTGEYGALIEIEFDALVAKLPEQGMLRDLAFKQLPDDKKYQKFSLYPFIVRDVAVFVPSTVAQTEVADLIAHNAGELCVKNWLFDVFEKEVTDADGVPTKKTSYAFRLVFQSFERTLEDKDATEVMEKIATEIKEKGWEIR